VKTVSLAAQPILDWLIDGARSQPMAQEVLTELCERLSAAGLPLWRAVVFVRTLHPQIVGRRFIWLVGTGTVVTEGAFDLLERDVFRNSPMAHVIETGEAFRRRLADPDCPLDYPILDDLRKEGVTDYVVSPLHFTNGEIHFAAWATQQPGGFTDEEVDVIRSVVAPLARVAEIRAWYRVAGNLLATYVGTNAEERVLAGHIRRGDTERSTRRSGCPTCVVSRGLPIAYRRRPWSTCSTVISIAKCRQYSITAARCLNSWATACWLFFP
jgi:adenylate cyclase